MKKALEVGYRHLDCAYVYRNEAEIGGALECSLKSLNLKREDVFVTSKVIIHLIFFKLFLAVEYFFPP